MLVVVGFMTLLFLTSAATAVQLEAGPVSVAGSWRCTCRCCWADTPWAACWPAG
jgi:hypothetical protein